MLDRRANVFSVFTFIFTLLVIVTSVLALADCFDDFTTALFMVMILTCLTMCCHVCDGVVRARHWESDADEKLGQISRTHEDGRDDEDGHVPARGTTDASPAPRHKAARRLKSPFERS